jgi:RNA polymerase primary sigma factor
LYLREIGSAPLLTAQEEVELAQELEAGRAARGRLEAGKVPAAERAWLDESVRMSHALSAYTQLVTQFAECAFQAAAIKPESEAHYRGLPRSEVSA